MNTSRLPLFLILAGLSLPVLACAPAEEGQEAATTAEVQLPDTTGAAMWAYLQEVNYRESWTLWPDKGEFYAGTQPHGMLLTTYLNDAALEALTSGVGSMSAGAIVVKENYMPDTTLAAITTMFKVDGYNPDHNDWFFTKHLASGELDTAPNGMALEGRLMGCQNCHMARAGNDYIYTASLSQN
jgi:hypothetical protein